MTREVAEIMKALEFRTTTDPRYAIGNGLALECRAEHGIVSVRPAGVSVARTSVRTALKRLGSALADEFGEAARAAATPGGTSPALWHRL